MPTAEFLEQIFRRLDRIDRQSLERYVSELSQERQLLTTLLDQVPYGIAVLTERKECLYLNRRMIQLLNVPDSIRPKAKLEEIITDSSLADWIVKTLERNQEVFHEEVEVLLPRPMMLQITVVFERMERTRIAILFVSNLTQIEMNTRERFQLQNWESLMSLAAGIAHEIGNPLNSLTIHLNLLSKALEKIQTRDKRKMNASLAAAKGETARLDGIVRNFLRATRRKPIHFELTHVNDLTDKTIAFLKPELNAARVKVIKSLDQKLPPFLLDSERMRQVFLNLIKNAMHAMPKGGTLHIQTEMKEKLCRIHFQDTGMGIPEDKVPRIFDAYYTTKEEGSGLGLLIVYQIIREHGGRIEVVSKPKVGTTFTILLPIRKEKLGLPGPKYKVGQ